VWARIPHHGGLITHDIDEALFLADRILVMSPRPGRIVEDLRIDFGRPARCRLVDAAGLHRAEAPLPGAAASRHRRRRTTAAHSPRAAGWRTGHGMAFLPSRTPSNPHHA